ncbi:MAG: hypothetical protein GAK30_01938 [Paracidovorax wautersii]|uniref:Uncharacterized protein n=1 Tax=Paracidovorax wautersii TaxID=1177982 RepID=A0A7V8FP11_9BURK|nr:MAG: hypothetical protein GAK30_01938 [Paracidovorax wautersii]
MTTPSTPSPRLAPGARTTPLAVAPGQTTLLCLPPGHALLCLEGSAVLRQGPLLWGQVLHAARQSLAPGQAFHGGHDGQSVWLQISARAPGTAHLLVVAPAAAPGWLRQGLRRLRAWLRPAVQAEA